MHVRAYIHSTRYNMIVWCLESMTYFLSALAWTRRSSTKSGVLSQRMAHVIVECHLITVVAI